MKLEGRITVATPLEEAWARINDPRVLESCAPGLSSLVSSGEDRFEAVVELDLAAVQGRFTGSLDFVERQAPEFVRVRLEGKGGLGFVVGDVELRLAETDEGTEFRYVADVNVGGQIGRLGQRMVSGVTREMAGQFFESFERWEPTTDPGARQGGRPSWPRLLWRSLLRILGLRSSS
ncbi:MAG: carbon monoxide dehydrogenase subunit G [Myxococcota bacterium]